MDLPEVQASVLLMFISLQRTENLCVTKGANCNIHLVGQHNMHSTYLKRKSFQCPSRGWFKKNKTLSSPYYQHWVIDIGSLAWAALRFGLPTQIDFAGAESNDCLRWRGAVQFSSTLRFCTCSKMVEWPKCPPSANHSVAPTASSNASIQDTEPAAPPPSPTTLSQEQGNLGEIHKRYWLMFNAGGVSISVWHFLGPLWLAFSNTLRPYVSA